MTKPKAKDDLTKLNDEQVYDLEADDLSKFTDAELEHQIYELERELDDMRSLKRKPFKDDSLAAIDLTVTEARAAIDRLLDDALPRLAHSAGLPVRLPGLGDLWVLANDAAIAARFRERVEANDASGAYSALTRAEYNAKREGRQDEVARRRVRLDRRAKRRQVAALSAELGEVHA